MGRKLGLIQTLSRLCSPRPNFGRNSDWLLEQCHKIWLAVGINGSWKRLFLAWLFSRMISRRRREGSILLSFLLFYGLSIVEKYALICALEIQKIQMVVHIFSGFALFTGTNVSVSQSWISLQVVDRDQCVECALWFTNKRVQIQQILSMLKLFSFESLLLWTGFSSGGSLRKEPQSPTVKYYSWY